MSGKLDKSLDEILVNRRQGARRRSRRSATSKATTATVPVGGVKKSTKAAKAAGKVVPNGHPVSHESKIMVSGLVCILSLPPQSFSLLTTHSLRM